MSFQLVATAAFGLEAIVVRELKQLGYDPKITRPGRIEFTGDFAAVCRANLWLRSSDRVLIQLAKFPAPDFDALFDTVGSLPWEDWIAPDAGIPVRGRSHKSQLTSVPACQRTVKKAIVDRLLKHHNVNELPETGAPVSVEVALLDNEATISIDTSGVGLHKRGYRSLAAHAQLRETLAAALVQLSFWKPERALIDPFCGTGTIVIEAALIGRRMAPGRKRDFAADHWPMFPAQAWTDARQEADDLVLTPLPERPMGTDIDPEALSLARYHAEQAGVAEDLHFQQRAFADLTSKRQYGCTITNPPYGIRMGESEAVEALYRSMPEVFRRLKTWSHYVFSARGDMEILVGQKADRRRKLYNAQIECTYFQFYGPRPPRKKEHALEQSESESKQPEETQEPPKAEQRVPEEKHSAPEIEGKVPEAEHRVPRAEDRVPRAEDRVPGEEGRVPEAEGRVAGIEDIKEPTPTNPKPPTSNFSPPASPSSAFGGLRPEATRQAEEFANRLRKLARHLRRWPTKRGITCYRIYERDIPEIPLVVDRYEDALHITEYERPHERTAAEHADWLDHMVRTASATLDIPRDLTFVKQRARQRGDTQYERVDDKKALRVVQEAGLKFQVNLSDYIDTGLFLDHRTTRAMVRDVAQGKNFLNLFAYTGAFSVYAAAGGAAKTTSVDLSATYVQWAEDNLRLNGFEGEQHRLVCRDVQEFLTSPHETEKYDLAIVDPPTFSNSKRLDNDWDVQNDFVPLLQKVIAKMTSGGVIYFSTNSRRFKLDETMLRGATLREISKQTVPEDFRNKRIHRCWRMIVA